MPSYCYVKGCEAGRIKNLPKNKTLKLFSFPKDPKTCDKWIKFTKRTDAKVKFAKICSAHFRAEDYVDPTDPTDLRNRFGGSRMKGRLLKEGAYPTIPPGGKDDSTDLKMKQQQERMEQRKIEKLPDEHEKDEKEKQNQLQEGLISIPPNLMETSSEATDPLRDSDEDPESPSIPEIKTEPSEQTKDIAEVPPEINFLLGEIAKLKEKCFTLEQKNYELNLNNQRMSYQIDEVKKIWTKNQYEAIVKKSKERWWTNEEMTTFFILFSRGPSAYRFLRKNMNHPLPAEGSLLKWKKQKNEGPSAVERENKIADFSENTKSFT